MPEVAIIPVKSFRMGKQRLSGSMEPAEREHLGRRLAGHVAATVESAGLIPLVVTADPDVVAWATASAFPSLPDPGDGLDAAAATGVDWAAQSGSAWVVLHADLPLLTHADVTSIAEVVRSGTPAIAPSSDGGTSAIGWQGRFAFSFGVGSFHRHLARLESPRVFTRIGLLLDIDSPDDLAAARGRVPGLA